jgi:UDP-N-acetylglucosamine 2-epimerase (non-hydrolysing)
MGPVARALSSLGLEPALIFTGQHADLEPKEFGLDRFGHVSLACPGQTDPHAHVGEVTAALLPSLGYPPDLLLVQGDTSSALGAALAGFTAGVPVGHVEAGLRTHDPLQPWPEEEYRTAIDANADLLFAPTDLAAANLRAERVPGSIHVTGNTGIDALLDAIAKLPPPPFRDDRTTRLLVTCHRREAWDNGLGKIAAALRELAEDEHLAIDVLLHPNAFVASRFAARLAGVARINLLAPCDHREMLRRMRESDILLSDSGGIQEEAPALGIPLLILRDKTERPEGLIAGTSRLVGTDAQSIVSEVRRLLSSPAERAAMSRPVFPFGDGRAGPRIAAIVAGWLEERALTRRLA